MMLIEWVYMIVPFTGAYCIASLICRKLMKATISHAKLIGFLIIFMAAFCFIVFIINLIAPLNFGR